MNGRSPLILILILSLTALFLCLTLTACNGDNQPTAPTDAPSAEAPTLPATDAPTEVPTSDATEAPTDAATEPSTEAPVLMTVVDVDQINPEKLSSFFTRTAKCEIALVEDETEGSVIRLSSTGVSSAGSTKPYTYLKLGELVESMGGILPKTTEYPHVILKVKAPDLWSHSFDFFGGATLRDATNHEGSARTARVAYSEDWQYIYLDLSSFDGDLSYLYLNFQKAAGKNGEYMDIAEIRFFATAEEAAALTTAVTDTYPIIEQTPEDYTLKVMSFNIQTENGATVKDFGLRAELFRDLLDQLQPDSIGMQEVTTNWIYYMDNYAFNNSYAGVGEGRTPGGEASSIYYRKDKFEEIDSGTFWLSETPEKVGSYLENVNYPRICTWVHLKDKVTGFEYIHLNTHLDHNGNNDGTTGKNIRTNQVRIILEYIQKFPDVPMVLTGDFNQAKTTSEDVNYAMFKNILGESTFTTSTGEKLTGNFSDARADAVDAVSSNAWASMTSYWQEGTNKYNPAKKPIDYVFYTTGDFDAMVYRNIHYHRDGIYMSDHLPQYCELHVKVAAAE